mmetsp:Transcript_5986/g.6964  ORF Transcript_5986/g.6964 Transcript_5986/m.6964 type:complete len:96 (+) Transcript_5986:182-469(+)
MEGLAHPDDDGTFFSDIGNADIGAPSILCLRQVNLTDFFAPLQILKPLKSIRFRGLGRQYTTSRSCSPAEGDTCEGVESIVEGPDAFRKSSDSCK